MKDLLSKLSTYNLFNFLFPGVLFSLMSSVVTRYSFLQKDIIWGFFVYYFVGLVVSRFGSLVVEPLLKQLSVLNFANYRDFVEASKNDEKITLLSEVNNSYRTLVSMFILLFLLKLYEMAEGEVVFLKKFDFIILMALLLIVFFVSYVKQTSYVKKRVEANIQPRLMS